MTNKLIKQIKADREAGMPGPWRNTPNSGEITDEYGIYIARAIGAVTREGSANARRIALVPDMESRIFAGADRIEALEDENTRLREALENIAGDGMTYLNDAGNFRRCQEAARAALQDK